MATHLRYEVTLDRVHCIGCADCPKICPRWFAMQQDGKAAINKSALTDVQRRRIGEASYDCCRNAARICPAHVIHLFDTTSHRMIA